jgi:cell division protein FtsQ
VVVGINANDPAETRAERMQQYESFVAAINSVGPATGPKPSQQLSEVDVADPEDVRAMMPSAGADILVHFGDEGFANRYEIYQQHLKEWRQQYPHLAAIDLRYDRQTVLEMDKSANSNPANAMDTAPTLTATPSTRPGVAKHVAAKPAAKKKVMAKKPSRPVKAASKTPSRAVKGRDY